MGSCRWAKTLLLARRLISFRCVIDPYHPLPSHSPLYPFSWRACSSLARVYKIVYFANPYFLCACYAGQNKWKNPIHLPWSNRYPNRLLGALNFEDGCPSTWLHCGIYLSERFGFLCTQTFYAKFPVFVMFVFKIVTRALPLMQTPNHPATSKLRDRHRICLFFRAKGELRGRTRSESVSLEHSVKLPNKLTGATPHATKNLRHPG